MSRNRHAEDAGLLGALQYGVNDWVTDVLSNVLTQPGDSFSLHHMVAVDGVLDPLHSRTVSTKDDFGVRGKNSCQFRHFLRLDEVGSDEGDAHRVVVQNYLLLEALEGGKIKHRDVGIEVFGQEIQPEGAVLKAKRRQPLLPGNLIMEELHDVLFAAKLIIYTKRSKDAGEKNAFGGWGLVRLIHGSPPRKGRMVMNPIYHPIVTGLSWV